MQKEKSSKKWLIISIILFITFAMSTVIVAFLCFFPGVINLYSNNYKHRADKSMSESTDLKDIDTIDINCDIAVLSIEPYSGSTASIEYIAKEDSQIKLKKTNGKLTIELP